MEIDFGAIVFVDELTNNITVEHDVDGNISNHQQIVDIIVFILFYFIF